jgi:hypothetical protein
MNGIYYQSRAGGEWTQVVVGGSPVPAQHSQAPHRGAIFKMVADRINSPLSAPCPIKQAHGQSKAITTRAPGLVSVYPGLDLEATQALSEDHIMLPVAEGATIMLCNADSYHPPSPEWVAVRALLDGAADVSATCHQQWLHNQTQAGTEIDTGNGIAISPGYGNAHVMLGPDTYITLQHSQLLPKLSQQLLISEGQLEEMSIHVDRKAGTMTLKDGTIRPVERDS